MAYRRVPGRTPVAQGFQVGVSISLRRWLDDLVGNITDLERVVQSNTSRIAALEARLAAVEGRSTE